MQRLGFLVGALLLGGVLIVRNEMVDLSVYSSTQGPATWAEAVGTIVVAEGLAWGGEGKDFEQRVLFDRGHLFIGKQTKLPAGKLVRVTGKLQVGKHEPLNDPDAQQIPETYIYYYMNPDKVEPIESVTAAHLVRLSDR